MNGRVRNLLPTAKPLPVFASRTRRARAALRRHLPAMDALEAREVLSTLMVTNTSDTGPGSFRQTVETASAGDIVKFDPALNGQTIKWNSGAVSISKSLEIDGPGSALLTLNGNNSQIFRILSPASSVTISGLTLANGLDEAEGAAIHDWRGSDSSLTLRDDAFVNNKVHGDNARGGAVSKPMGTLTIETCIFKGNSVESLPGHGDASGGAVFAQGRLVVDHSQFEDGLANAGILPSQIFSTPGGNGRGGAIAYSAAANAAINADGLPSAGVLILDTKFENNEVHAGYGATLAGGSTDGGDAYGGGVSIETNNVDGLTIQVLASAFGDNHIYGGAAAQGIPGELPSSAGGAWGGGLWVKAGKSTGLVFLIGQGSVFNDNLAEGGNGVAMRAVADPKLIGSRPAGDAHGGGIAIEAGSAVSAKFSIMNSTFSSTAEGGHGGWVQPDSDEIWASNSGNAFGGGVWVDAGRSADAVFSVGGDTFDGSEAFGGFAGSVDDAIGAGGDGGIGEGGGLDFHGGRSLGAKLSVASSTFRDVKATGGHGGHGGNVVPSDFLHGVNVGGDSGDAYGGGMAIDYEHADHAAALLLANTLTGCRADGQVGGAGGPSLDAYNGHGGHGGDAYGGAIYVTAAHAVKPGLNILGGTVSHAVADAGRGGLGGYFVGSRISVAGHGGDGGTGGNAYGGGIYLEGGAAHTAETSVWTAIDLAINDNLANAGYGGDGGNGLTGGHGGASGKAEGGGLFTEFGGKLRLLKCNVTGNDVTRGLGGNGGKGRIPALDGQKGVSRAVHGPALAVEAPAGTVELVDTVIDSQMSATSPWVYDPTHRVKVL